MARYGKFTVLNDGSLVYRTSGRTAPGSYTVKGNRVYNAEGRLAGYVGKATSKAQRENVQQAIARRSAVAMKQLKGTAVLERAELGKVYKQLTLEERFRGGVYKTIEDVKGDNFARKLVGMVKALALDPEDAETLYQEYIASDDGRRSEMWNELTKDLAEYGFPPSHRLPCIQSRIYGYCASPTSR